MSSNTALPVAIIGAGPVGLAAASQLLSRGIEPLLLEAGPTVGTNFRSYGHVRLFSPWRYNVDRTAESLLTATGWTAPDADTLPTGGEFLDRYLMPLSAHPEIATRLRLGTRVRAITRAGTDKVRTSGRDRVPFTLRVETADGGSADIEAAAVIDASGTWASPNPLGADGLPALGELDFAAWIRYGIPDVLGRDRARYAGRRVLVVGAGHSAANSLLDLATLASEAPGTTLAWAVRGRDLTRVFGGGDADALPARGKLGTELRRLQERGGLRMEREFRIRALERDGNGIRVISTTGRVIDGVDEIVVATGNRPDLSLTRELRTRLDPWLEAVEALAPLIDPNVHSCGTVRPHGVRELTHPEPGYYSVGVKSYGRAPTFLLATGYEQVRSVAAALAGAWDEAYDVQLDLPETGVCSSGLPGGEACCSIPDAASAASAAPASGSCCS
jgi:glycine/D-amino acid oxidase-like deaminating enzyme